MQACVPIWRSGYLPISRRAAREDIRHESTRPFGPFGDAGMSTRREGDCERHLGVARTSVWREDGLLVCATKCQLLSAGEKENTAGRGNAGTRVAGRTGSQSTPAIYLLYSGPGRCPRGRFPGTSRTCAVDVAALLHRTHNRTAPKSTQHRPGSDPAQTRQCRVRGEPPQRRYSQALI